MEIEIIKPQIRRYHNDGTMTMCDNENARVITVKDGTCYFEILVGLTYTDLGGQDGLTQQVLRGGNRQLYSVTMAVGMTILGDMAIIKNRYGVNGIINGGNNVRRTIFDSLMGEMGFSNFTSMRIMCTFNQVVSELLDEPVMSNKEFPLGINYREWFIREQNRCMVKKYSIKRHSLI